MRLLLLVLPTIAIEVFNMEIKSSDGTMDNKWARAVFKEVVEEELMKAYGKREVTTLPEGESQHLDVSMTYNAGSGEEEVNVVLVYKHADGSVTRHGIKLPDGSEDRK